MKVTAFNKHTDEKIYEIELKECRLKDIADLFPATVTEQTRAVLFDDQEVR